MAKLFGKSKDEAKQPDEVAPEQPETKQEPVSQDDPALVKDQQSQASLGAAQASPERHPIMTEEEAREAANKKTVNQTIPTSQTFTGAHGEPPQNSIVIAQYERKHQGPIGRAQKLAQLLTDFGWVVGIATDGEKDTLWGYQPKKAEEKKDDQLKAD